MFISHGFGEHSGRYDRQAAEFNRKGLLVFSHDHQGHGRSAGERGDISDYRYLDGNFFSTRRTKRERKLILFKEEMDLNVRSINKWRKRIL